MSADPWAFPRALEEGCHRVLVRPPSRPPPAPSLSGSLLILSGLLPAAAAAPVLAASTELFISEYIEGTSNNKAVEIYNGTGARSTSPATSSDVLQRQRRRPATTIDLAGTLAHD